MRARALRRGRAAPTTRAARVLLCSSIIAGGVVGARPGPDDAKPSFDLAGEPGIVDAAARIPALLVELKYSTTDNFVGKDVYGDLERCYLVEDAARMLAAADAALRRQRPDLRLLAYDCLRPRRVQRVLWDVVKGTPQQSYVANPNTKVGSLHNYGCAIDLTVARVDDDGAKAVPLDMGTKYDHFGKEAEPRHELKLLSAGQLSHEQVANRLLLREVMLRAGFLPLENEWWHFNCASSDQTRKRYRLVD